jgi:hypothetical protein
MLEFLDVAEDLLRSKAVEDRRADFETVFETIGKLQAVHSKAQLDLMNLESIFTVLELGKVLRTIPRLQGPEIEKAIDSLKIVIAKTLEVVIKFNVDSSGRLEPPSTYKKFSELLEYLSQQASPPQTVSVITFNYDIAADMAMSEKGLGPDYIIEKPRSHGSLTIPLMKLHGSLNWATEAPTKKIQILHLSDYLEKITIRGPFNTSYPLEVATHLHRYFEEFKPAIEVDSQPLFSSAFLEQGRLSRSAFRHMGFCREPPLRS